MDESAVLRDGLTRGRVMGVALKLFAERGFAAVGIREIADSAGLTASSLYHYMGGKQDLLVEIMTDGLRRHIQAATKATEGLDTPEQCIVALVRTHVIVQALQQRSALVIDNEVWSLRKEGLKQVLPMREQYESLWRLSINTGMKTGAFSVRDGDMARLALLEMCNGVSHWFRLGGALTVGEIADRFAELALSALNARRSTREPNGFDAIQMRPSDYEIELAQGAYEGFYESSPSDLSAATEN